MQATGMVTMFLLLRLERWAQGKSHVQEKRRGEKVSPPTTTSSAPGGDKFFPDFCVAFGQPQSHVRVQRLSPSAPSVGRGCVSIAEDVVTGAVKGSFCIGSTGWRQWCSALYFLSRRASSMFYYL
jgi:hypothetical protein